MSKKDFQALVKEKVAAALDIADLDMDVTIPDEQFGDYSTNVAMIASKRVSKNPMDIANDLAMKLKADKELTGVFKQIEAVSPGFVNFYLADEQLLSNLNFINHIPERYGSSEVGKDKLAIVEYFQLNVAKPPHIGHIRSAVIGDSLKRILISQGYKTVSDTHIGDWGTQFGLLLWAYKNLDGRGRVKDSPLEELNELYVEVNKMIENDPEVRERGKQEFVKLEQGDEENRKLWEFFVSVSKKEFAKYIEELQLLTFEYDLGESFYEEQMKDVLKRLEEEGFLKEGETGEKYIDLEEYKLGRLICVKSDGGTTYELRDLATVAYRYDEIAKKESAELAQNLYIVDVRQSHDFKQVFKTMELLGYDMKKSEHVEFGFLTLPEGAMSTRKGTAIKLGLLLEEAKKRALKIIEEKNPGLKDKEKVAENVGLAALKYADLSANRKSDIIFDWDRALTFEGDTGPYLQYSHARLKSILRRGNVDGPQIQKVVELSQPEHDLLRFLLHFPAKVKTAAENYTPNTIANYLYELSSKVNYFYQEVPVLQEENRELREFRLALVAAAATVLHNGLYLLGIEAPEEM